MTPEEREAAWFEVHGLLPPGWRVGPCQYDPASRAWTVAAWHRPPGRLAKPQAVDGRGKDELAAVRDLAERLRVLRAP